MLSAEVGSQPPGQNPIGCKPPLCGRRTESGWEFFENWHWPALLTLSDPRGEVLTLRTASNRGLLPRGFGPEDLVGHHTSNTEAVVEYIRFSLESKREEVMDGERCKARYTLATKLNSTRSTLLKVDCCRFAETGKKSATESTVAVYVQLCCQCVRGQAKKSRLSTKSTILNSTLSPVCTGL